MSTLNLEDQGTPTQSPSKVPAILKGVLLAVLAIAILASATANGYLYLKSRETDHKLNALQSSLSEVANDVASIKRQSNSDLERDVNDIASKLDSMEEDIQSIKRDVSSIESDVSSIQLKIGY